MKRVLQKAIWHIQIIALALLLSVEICSASDRFTAITADCDGLKNGESDLQLTKLFTTRDGSFQAKGRVLLKRKGKKCTASYVLMVKHSVKGFKAVYETGEVIDEGGPAWLELIGMSPDHKRFAADIGWSAGDYDHHQPTVYTLQEGSVIAQSLDDQIMGQLPSCDYFQLFTGITNAGEAVIHIPESIYVDNGCPDQGDWLFNLHTGKVRRVKAK